MITFARTNILSAITKTALAVATIVGAFATKVSADPSQSPSFKPVLELYTSQGCSSCPPADAYLGKLKGRKDIVALSLPVDYWDYIGWKDTLARPENAVRQRLFAKRSGLNSVYTPQIIVNGVTHAVGSRPKEIEKAIQTARNHLAERSVSVQLELNNNNLVITTGTASKPGKPATIWFAPVSTTTKVMIKRGENSGRAVSYHNVVHDLRKVGEWNGEATSIKLSYKKWLAGKGDSCAILIQEGVGGPIIGAAIMRTVGS